MGRVAPLQERGKIAERNIINAAQQAFAEHGYSGARVADIVKLAGSSTGSFYFRFKNKDALFEFMLDDFIDKSRRVLAQVPVNFNSLPELLEWQVTQHASLLEQNHGFYRAVNEVSISNPATWNTLRLLTSEIAASVVLSAAPFKDVITAPNWQQAVFSAVEFISGNLTNQASHHKESILNSKKNIDLHVRASMGIMGVFVDYRTLP